MTLRRALHFALLLRERTLHRRALSYALEVRGDLGRLVDVDPVGAEPLGDSIEIAVAHRVVLAHHPRALEHLALDQREAFADRLRHLLLHALDRGRIVGPAIAA